MLQSNGIDGIAVDRRTGGLETDAISLFCLFLVDRRTGGLENVSNPHSSRRYVDRRTGGLETE